MVSQISAPPLESGDRLSRTEFERRYAQASHLKAELIEGGLNSAEHREFRDRLNH